MGQCVVDTLNQKYMEIYSASLLTVKSNDARLEGTTAFSGQNMGYFMQCKYSYTFLILVVFFIIEKVVLTFYSQESCI